MRVFKTFQVAIFSISTVLAMSCNAQEQKDAKPATAPAASAGAASTTGTMATVNGVAIPQARLELLVRERVQQGQPDSPEMRKALREELINRELIAQEANKKGLNKNADVIIRQELAKQAVLDSAFMQDYLKNTPVNEDALKAEYERIKAQLGSKEYRIRHILVEKETEAKDIIAQLKKGAKFDKLAKEKSKDPGSKDRGGDLDWSTPGSYVKPFADAVVKLKKGQYTQEPVQTQFGWHVIKVEDERALKVPGFQEVKGNLQQRMQQQQIDKLIADLRAKAKIE